MISQDVQFSRVAARAQTPLDTRSWWAQWPRIAPVAAAAWSLAYAGLGVFWTVGGAGYPYASGPDHQGPSLSILGDASPALLSLVIAVWGLVGALAAVLMARRIGQRALRSVLLVIAGATAVTLGLIIPDYRVLVFVAYAPVVVLGAPFGWPPGTNILQLVTWPLVNQLLCISGGSIWCAAAVAYARQTGGACAYCGRSLRALQPRGCWPPKNCASNLSQAGVMFWLRRKRLVGS